MILSRRHVFSLLLTTPLALRAAEREKEKEKEKEKEREREKEKEHEKGRDKEKERGGKKPEEPKEKEGTAEGEVVAKGETWVEIRSAGETRKYTPRWIGGMPKDGGGLDKDMLKAIRGLERGQHIRFKWIWEERYRIVEILR